MVNLKMLNKDENSTSFLIQDTNEATVNTIRRLAVDEVPTLAIEDVKFVKNSSAMFDEYIAHRLGLVVLKTDLKSYTLPENCKCKGKGCAQCQLFFKLKVKGPATVYAEELASKDPKVKAVYPKTVMLKLLKKQTLEVEAKAILGKGKNHIKFSPGIVYYQGVPTIKVLDNEKFKEYVDVCPKKIFTASNGKVKISDVMKCDLCMACAEESYVSVEGSKKDFIVNVEPFGQLSAKEMLTEAVKVFDGKLNEFSKLIGKI